MKRIFCLVLLIVMPLAAKGAQAQGCVRHFGDEKGDIYVQISSNYLSGSSSRYSDSNCETFDSTYSWGDDGAAYSDSESGARAICQSNLGSGYIGVNRMFGNSSFWKCRGGGSSRGGKRSAPKATPRPVPKATPRPVVHTGIILNLETDLRVSAVNGLTSGIQFQRVGPAGVGIQSLVDLGVLDAVDVWSFIGGGYEVCFPQSGNIVFLDTANIPRIPELGDGYVRDGYTCASEARPGIVVLMKAAEGTERQPETAVTTSQPGARDDIADAIDLVDCRVTPRVYLNLREGPWEVILDVLPANSELPATARTENWFKVTYEEIEGWSAAWLVDTEGDCDWEE